MEAYGEPKLRRYFSLWSINKIEIRDTSLDIHMDRRERIERIRQLREGSVPVYYLAITMLLSDHCRMRVTMCYRNPCCYTLTIILSSKSCLGSWSSLSLAFSFSLAINNGLPNYDNPYEWHDNLLCPCVWAIHLNLPEEKNQPNWVKLFNCFAKISLFGNRKKFNEIKNQSNWVKMLQIVLQI